MTRRRPLEPIPPRETDLEGPVRRFLEAEGYRVYVDPDGGSFFDVVARREVELGLVELKLTDWKTLRRQGVVRRSYGDWTAVVLPRRSAADRLLARSEGELSRPIGVWCLERGEVEVVRPAQPWPAATRASFAQGRSALLALLDARDSGLLPEGVEWPGFGSARTVGQRRSLREFRIEEYDPQDPASPG